MACDGFVVKKRGDATLSERPVFDPSRLLQVAMLLADAERTGVRNPTARTLAVIHSIGIHPHSDGVRNGVAHFVRTRDLSHGGLRERRGRINDPGFPAERGNPGLRNSHS